MNDESASPKGRTPPIPEVSAATAANVVLTRRSNERIPLSLGKGSLRIRLEAYYSLISPDTLSDQTVWLRKYDQIYEKYGGTHQGERKLATKLAKKYGTTLRLLLVTDQSSSTHSNKIGNEQNSNPTRDESWYRLCQREAGSGVVDFLSPDFDPIKTLTSASSEDIARANPWMAELLPKTILDNVGKCATLLPKDDPLRKESHHHQVQLRKPTALKTHVGQQQQQAGGTLEPSQKRPRRNNSKNNNNVDLHPFEAIASHLDSGPHSLLFRLRRDRKRVKVVVRYVNMLRGTIAGSLVAFDKHMNLILRDVEEVYCPRIANEKYEMSNRELELERRRRISLMGDREKGVDQSLLITAKDDMKRENESSIDHGASNIDSRKHHQQHQQPPGTWNVRRRQMKQLLVRGDMVVSIYEAAQEKTNVQKSRYRKRMATVAAAAATTNRNEQAAKQAS
uniref:Sm domain-containing protein n=2 Tax=Pseudo-nitzschia australis TaxID=44445 RepID=A0A7S4AHE2_9STRA|mmetsp:Transcript_11185/g.23761  ORF Transcript_11185/g.23761 Transcript_11185/m.23761 type:complete len:451 (-) Transcript_11185:347-1699(-)